ncbi:unnamed protein product [Sphenostylis stenocarpa]|uniref:Uncharacterized protein n=1 Tax=Sphenostylis stenocarpa TaxID=92480 RepID=A0AA86W1T5_9FABA|nr:unnamed protein product [Sphenostylis stenocarpa]
MGFIKSLHKPPQTPAHISLCIRNNCGGGGGVDGGVRYLSTPLNQPEQEMEEGEMEMQQTLIRMHLRVAIVDAHQPSWPSAFASSSP